MAAAVCFFFKDQAAPLNLPPSAVALAGFFWLPVASSCFLLLSLAYGCAGVLAGSPPPHLRAAPRSGAARKGVEKGYQPSSPARSA